jgi:hypothetical protein
MMPTWYTSESYSVTGIARERSCAGRDDGRAQRACPHRHWCVRCFAASRPRVLMRAPQGCAGGASDQAGDQQR